MNDIINIKKVQSPAVKEVSNSPASLFVRNAIGYGLIYVVATALVSYFLVVTINPGNTSLKSIGLPASLYLLLGVFFAVFLHSKLNFQNKLNLNSGPRYAVIIFACVFLVTLLTGFIKGNSSVLSVLFYSSLFLIPYLVYQTWLFYKSLYSISYDKIWYLPEYTRQASVATIFLNSIRIKIKVSTSYGTPEKIYETTVPGRISVGTMFTKFIYDEKDVNANNDAFKDIDDYIFGWQFYTPGFLGVSTREIDPNLSLNENRIKDHTIVIAKIARRIPKQLN